MAGQMRFTHEVQLADDRSRDPRTRPDAMKMKGSEELGTPTPRAAKAAGNAMTNHPIERLPNDLVAPVTAASRKRLRIRQGGTPGRKQQCPGKGLRAAGS